MIVFNITTETQPRISYVSSLRNTWSSDGARHWRLEAVCDRYWPQIIYDTDHSLLSVFWNPSGNRSRGRHNNGRPEPFLNCDPESHLLATQIAWIQTCFKCSAKIFQFQVRCKSIFFTWLESRTWSDLNFSGVNKQLFFMKITNRLNKPGKTRRVEHVTRIWNNKNAYSILKRKSERRIPLGRPMRIWQDIKIHLGE